MISSSASAQVAGDGSIQGTVTDPSGAVVPQAQVTATNNATGVQTTRLTTGAGLYVITPLPAGEYTLKVAAQSFQLTTQQNVVVDAVATTDSYELDWGSPVRPGFEGLSWFGCPVPLRQCRHIAQSGRRWPGQDAYWMAERISEAYIAFAKTRNPNNSKLPHWPPYDLTNRATMVFDKVSKVVNDPRSEPCKMWSQGVRE